ncbi:alpha/beta hydrolase [Streptomyces coeruleorubidus]|uniref:alpha/beta hydrolase n=1 Tax=Streptomyces coeruleorubidus TaxID=116188 RepID=UPI0036B5B534
MSDRAVGRRVKPHLERWSWDAPLGCCVRDGRRQVAAGTVSGVHEGNPHPGRARRHPLHALPAGRAAGSVGLLVYFHGDGWVLGSRRTHDNTARFLALRAGVRVLSVEHRLAGSKGRSSDHVLGKPYPKRYLDLVFRIHAGCERSLR